MATGSSSRPGRPAGKRGTGAAAPVETGRAAAHPHPVDPARVAEARARVPSAEEALALSAVLTLIADPTRARLIYALDLVEELCVGDLAMVLGATEDAVSYGLRVLRTAGLVTRRKQGRTVFYRLADGFPEPLREHCLRRLIELTRADDFDEGSAYGSRRASRSGIGWAP